jgi:hypothetical protein
MKIITKKGNEFKGNLSAAKKMAESKKATTIVIKNYAVTMWKATQYIGKATTCRPFVPPTK